MDSIFQWRRWVKYLFWHIFIFNLFIIMYIMGEYLQVWALKEKIVQPQSHIYTVRIKIKVIHIQRPIVLKSNDLKICMWHIGEEQLILFLLVPFLHQVCHAWPSTLPLKMTMSWPTFCKFWQLDKSPIDKQCNGVAAEIVSSHARWMRWSFPFWKILNSKVLATSPCALEDLSGVFDQN